MLVSKAVFYFQLHILSIQWKQMDPKDQQFLIRNPFLSQLLSSHHIFLSLVLVIFFSPQKKVLILKVKAEIYTGKIRPYIKNKLNFSKVYFRYTFRHIVWTRHLKKAKNKYLFSHFLATFERQLSPYRWLEVFNILHLLSLICLAQTPVETFS